MPSTKSQAIYGGGRIFLAVNTWGFFVSQKEMRHLASQDMSLPYLSAERFKNRSVDEGNVWATKSTERKHRYVKPPDKGTTAHLEINPGTPTLQKKPKNLHMPTSLYTLSGAQVHF